MKHEAPYIVIEGCDGTGKSTQARLLAEWLRGYYDCVAVPREPFFETTRTQARLMCTADARSLVYEADRLSQQKILSTVTKRPCTVQDRSYLSTIAYQDPSPEVRDFLLREREHKPDLVFMLEAPAEALRGRLEARGDLDEYECDVEFQQLVRERYAESLFGAGLWVYHIDALQTVTEIHEEIKKVCIDWFNLNETGLVLNG